MSRDELDLDSLAAEPVVPADPRRAALWAAGIAACAIAVLFLLLTSDLVFGRTVALTAPARFGDWTADPDVAAVVAEWMVADQQALGVEPFSAAYIGRDDARVLLWGGTGEAVQKADAGLLRERTLRLVPGVEAGDTAGADPGRNRGRASCTAAMRAGTQYTSCGWIFGRAGLGLLIVGPPGLDPGAVLRQVLDNVVTRR